MSAHPKLPSIAHTGSAAFAALPFLGIAFALVVAAAALSAAALP